MTTLSINKLWAFLQSLSLTASNEQWLAEKLKESAAAKRNSESAARMEALESIYGAWNDAADADAMEKAIAESRNADYVRQIASLD